jgi:putative endonuclease
VLAAVEVKARATLEAALEAVSLSQRQRLRRAIRALAARRRGLEHAQVRLDLMALAPGRFPRHIRDAWSQDADHG